MEELQKQVAQICKKAKEAAYSIASASTQQKNTALRLMAEDLWKKREEIQAANQIDIQNATVMIDRLRLDEKRIQAIVTALYQLCELPDPVGTGDVWVRPNGLKISRIRVPLGVIGMIYEARPNVTVDAAALCLKSGNAVVLRGGKEAIHTNEVLVTILQNSLEKAGLQRDAIGLIANTTRESAVAFMQMRDFIDVLIPRGGAGLIQNVVQNAKIPVIETGAGNCHLYVDESADLAMAVSVAVNAKMSRPSVCNAIETLLVHQAVAEKFLPWFAKEAASLEIHGCERTQKILSCLAATEEDYRTEYNDYTIAIKVVDTIEEAIAHINHYNTKHSEAILTSSMANAELFQNAVDAAVVYVNASTRYTDGEEFGFGAEIGISTQKLHARGPMGLQELTTIKYLIHGNGQVR